MVWYFSEAFGTLLGLLKSLKIFPEVLGALPQSSLMSLEIFLKILGTLHEKSREFFFAALETFYSDFRNSFQKFSKLFLHDP